jgi:hypothetical protein
MKVFKHVISTITLISLILVVYATLSIEKDSGMIKALLFSTYSIFTFFVLLTYRVSLIGKEKINWVALGLTVALALSLFMMESDKGLVYSLWDFTLVGFILLCGEAIFQIIPKKRPLSLTTKILTISILALFTSIVVFQIGSPTLFYFAEWLMILLSLLLIVNFFLKTKKA